MWEGVSDPILGVVFDDQSRHLDTEPTCRMTVRSEDSFDFVFLVDGGNDGFRIFVNALVVAKGAGVDFVDNRAAPLKFLEKTWNGFDTFVAVVLENDCRI